MSAEDLVPGIKAYPDLVERLRHKIAKEACGGCKESTAADDFRKIVERRQKRDKLRGKG